MGWNQGYTIFEATVIGAYDLGKLDKGLLIVLMEPYRNSDIDSGGKMDLKTHDGKCIEQVVIETWGLKSPIAPTTQDDTEWDKYYAELYVKMKAITQFFGWY